MGLKTIVKKIIAISKEKEIVPVSHNVDLNQILKDKVAIIIGGSGGIGLAVAKSFYESGCKVIICGTNESKLIDCVSGFPDDGQVRYMVFNITKFYAIRESVIESVNIFGKVDILVNSAGVHTDKIDFFSINPEEYDRIMNINLKGPYFVCQEYGNYMIRNKIKGHILLVSSSRGSEPAWSPYGISKWALNGITKGLAQMLMPYGIVVNGIAPGSTATELIGVKEGDSIYTFENRVNRLIIPDEVANVAKLLVSSAGDMIIGETIHISGGRGTVDIR
jgi:NAD(P)-dependent dehydrogenase (short-subunit alcohol dehydrogenase family)